MSIGIRIDDLASPVLTEVAQGLLGSVTEEMVVLEPQALMAMAQEQAGLSDFGDMSFVERLTRCCDAFETDTDLSTMGRITASAILTRNLVQRLRHEKLWADNPSIANTKIDRPIIIAGLPRTGTTHMLNLISADDRLRSLQYWESVEPFPAPGEPTSGDANDPRVQRCIDEFEFRDQIMPYFKNMHEMLPHHIHEETELQTMDFSTQFVEVLGIMPQYRDWYLANDQTPAYAYMKRALQALQWTRGPERWILKSPQHMEQLVPLRNTFPDATFVITHRDPVSIIASLGTMICYSGRIGRKDVKPKEIFNYWAGRLENWLRVCVAEAPKLPQEQTIHIRFDDFMANDMATIDKIYSMADHPLTPAVAGNMQQYIADNPRGKHGQILYNVKQDFGVDPEELYERYKFYTDYFNLPLEQKV